MYQPYVATVTYMAALPKERLSNRWGLMYNRPHICSNYTISVLHYLSIPSYVLCTYLHVRAFPGWWYKREGEALRQASPCAESLQQLPTFSWTPFHNSQINPFQQLIVILSFEPLYMTFELGTLFRKNPQNQKHFRKKL